MLHALMYGAFSAISTFEPHGPHGPPVTKWLVLGPCDAKSALVWELDQTTGLLHTSSSCLNYGGYSEGNTGLSQCTGWVAPAIGGQVWNRSTSPLGNGTFSFSVEGSRGKQLAAWDCGVAKGTNPVEVCSSDGSDCGQHGPGCRAAFAWHLDSSPSAIGSTFILRSATSGNLCVGASEHAPSPSPHPPHSQFPDGGGAWDIVCNATAACPEGNTCCKLASTNWGCCPGPNATCCSSGTACCPAGYKCSGSNRCLLADKAEADSSISPPEKFQSPPSTKPRQWPSSAKPRQWNYLVPTPAALFVVKSADGSMSISIDATSGAVTKIVVSEQPFAFSGEHSLPALANLSGWQVDVVPDTPGPTPGRVTVAKTLPGHAKIVIVYSTDASTPGAVKCTVTVTGLRSTIFTSEIASSFLTDQATSEAELRWWAPWDRDSYHTGVTWTNPLLPSDGGYGFWSGSYVYGIVYHSGGKDMVVAPLVAVLHPHSDKGWSLQMDPTEPGMAWAEHLLLGINSSLAAGFVWQRHNIRLAMDTPITFTSHIVGHAACWRPALQFHVEKYNRSWTSIATKEAMHRVDGLGSYGSYPIVQFGQNGSALDLPVIKKLHYRVNWDLSGRFYHYMGMYAPPIGNGAPERWLNRWIAFAPTHQYINAPPVNQHIRTHAHTPLHTHARDTHIHTHKYTHIRICTHIHTTLYIT